MDELHGSLLRRRPMSDVFGSATEHPFNEFSDTKESPIEIGGLRSRVPPVLGAR